MQSYSERDLMADRYPRMRQDVLYIRLEGYAITCRPIKKGVGAVYTIL